ncbi:chemotaxis protein CheB [Salinisphaera sp. T31B1]|uniref:chemotaxis protein CheB n=1 Tax=Salinisphaera sp. T31B1 TaxID=727963 RepID=UPI003340F243
MIDTERHEALAIGGSAGSLPVVIDLLAELAADTALVVVLCLHMGRSRAGDMARVLGRRCALPVSEAGERQRLAPGHVYFAAGGYHLLVERDRRFALCAGERVNFVRPAIDILFESMADAYRDGLAGMLLSGANADGASGLEYIQRLGGLTLVQSPNSAMAAQMPSAALDLFTPDRVHDPMGLGQAVRALSRS